MNCDGLTPDKCWVDLSIATSPTIPLISIGNIRADSAEKNQTSYHR